MRTKLMLILGIILVLAPLASASPPRVSPIDDTGTVGAPPVGVTPPSGSRDPVITNLNTSESFATLQAAIDDAETVGGHVLEFLVDSHSEGATPQIVINKAVTIQGKPSGGTTLTALANSGTSGDGRAWINITAAGVTLSNLTLDGSGYQIYFGVYTSGSANNTVIDDCTLRYIRGSVSSYDGRGIAVYAGAAQVTDCDMDHIGRIGVYSRGSTVATTIDNLTYAGKGDGDWLDYGVEAESGAVVTVNNSSITGCTGVALVDGSGSAGVMATTYFALGTTLVLDGCRA